MSVRSNSAKSGCSVFCFLKRYRGFELPGQYLGVNIILHDHIKKIGEMDNCLNCGKKISAGVWNTIKLITDKPTVRSLNEFLQKS